MFSIVERIPSVSEYQRLRNAVGWYVVNDEQTAIGLQNSLYSVCLLQESNVVGCGRIIGDAGIYYYIQDIIVVPRYQGQGGGRLIMDAVMRWLSAHAATNAFVGLMAAKDVSDFYKKYGFAERPADRPGMYIVWKK